MQDDGSSSQLQLFFRNKWVRLILCINVLAIITVIGIIIFNSTKSATIVFDVTPMEAKITLNGSGDYTNGSYSVHPGTYEVKITHPDLDSKTFTVNLDPNHIATLTTFLSKDNNFDFYELKENYGNFEKLADMASEKNNRTTDQDTSAKSFISRFQKAYELYKTALPIKYTEHDHEHNDRTLRSVSIQTDYENECQKYLCIKVVIFNADEQFANQFLIDKGFKLEDYEIIYKTF